MENTEIAVRNGHNGILKVLNSDYRNVKNKTFITKLHVGKRRFDRKSSAFIGLKDGK